MSKVFLGMSGGVDSSVSAVLLKAQGYDVVGVYMKNWSTDLPGMKCPWAEDLADAKRVAVQLDIDFEVWDFEADYKVKVVDYMLAEFAKGRTPNPDVMCNEQIKFKLFYERALERGADFIATGHYARTANDQLLRAVDENKDQTYFLYRMSDAALAKTIFPIGQLTKPEVKELAKHHNLDVATKKESMGVCFVGEVGMKDFLQEYLSAKPGEIREAETDQILGYHDGALFYTLGQRHGLYLGGGLPFYVVGKDLAENIVYASRNLNHENLWTQELALENLHLRNGLTLADLAKTPDLKVRLRHRAPLVSVQAKAALLARDSGATARMSAPAPQRRALATRPEQERGALASEPTAGGREGLSREVTTRRKRERGALASELALVFASPIKRPAPGQSAVFYSGETCLGGGVIAK